MGCVLGWLGLGRVRSGWLGLGWIGLGWFGLGWVGWGWVGVGFARMHTGTHACTRAGMHVRTPASQIVGVCGCYGEPIAPWLWRADLKPVQEHGAVHMQFCPIPASSARLYTNQAPCADQTPSVSCIQSDSIHRQEVFGADSFGRHSHDSIAPCSGSLCCWCLLNRCAHSRMWLNWSLQSVSHRYPSLSCGSTVSSCSSASEMSSIETIFCEGSRAELAAMSCTRCLCSESVSICSHLD